MKLPPKSTNTKKPRLKKVEESSESYKESKEDNDMSLDIDEDLLKEESELKPLGKKRGAKEITKSKSPKPQKWQKSPSPEISHPISGENLPLAGITIVISG